MSIFLGENSTGSPLEGARDWLAVAQSAVVSDRTSCYFLYYHCFTSMNYLKSFNTSLQNKCSHYLFDRVLHWQPSRHHSHINYSHIGGLFLSFSSICSEPKIPTIVRYSPSQQSTYKIFNVLGIAVLQIITQWHYQLL